MTGPWEDGTARGTAPHDVGLSRRVHLPAVSIEEHVNPDHLLLWQVRGTSDFVLDDRPRTLRAGHALWVPTGVRHGFTTHVNAVLLPMFFPVATTATTLREATVFTVDHDLRTLLLAFVQTTYSIIQPHVNIARQILARLEEQPARSGALPLPTTASALVVAETLRFNPGDDRSVEELAGAAHVSARTIGRAFVAETGMTLRRWRIANRMEAAGTLLRSRTTLDAVAHRVGYTDTSAFRRVFKAHFGMTPGEYVARFRTEL